MRRIGVALAVVVVLLVIAVVATARWGDRALWPPEPGSPTVTVFVVNHGYHAGIIVARRALAEEASRRGLSALRYVATRFADFDNLEIGWGDEGFYREVPTMQSLTVALALRALFRPGNPSVLHVVGVNADPRASFGNSDLVRLELSTAGFARLANKLDASFARAPGGLLPVELGRGLYGTSLFFRANGTFHIFNGCNHWVAGLLDVAGVPTAPVIATLPDGLLLDLAWRSGRERMPALNEPRK
jgi:uncharacterized protein (TIGR02117 family)